ncbi:MAG: MFS transporter [Actinomycetes bacterium]
MTASGDPDRHRSLSLLRREPALLRLLGGAAISGMADWCYGVVLLVWITSETHASPAWIAAATVARLLPYAIASPIGGAIADRYDARRLLVSASVLRAGLLLALAWVTAIDGPIPLALGLVVIAEAVGAAYRPTVLSVIPGLVSERETATANSTFGGVMQVSLLVGPAVAAAGLAAGDPDQVLLVTAAALIVSALTVPRLTGMRFEDAAVNGSIGRSLLEGVRALARAPGAPYVLMLVAVSEFVFGAEGVAQVLIAADRLGRPASVGILVAAVGLGGLIAAPVVPRVAERPRLVGPFVLANLLGAIPLMLLSLPRSVGGAVVILLAEGCGVIAYEVLLITLLQRIVPRSLLGRVFGLQGSLVIGSQVLGAMCAPFIIGALGLEAGIVVIGGSLAVASVALWRPMARADAASASYARRWAPYVAVLRGLPILDGVPQALLEQVAESVVERRTQPGEILIQEGDEADVLYVVREGTFEAVTVEPGGGERLLSRMGPAAWFGEIGLLGRRPRTATVRATSVGTVWVIPGEVFLDAVEGGPAIADPLQRTMLRRLANHGGAAA